MGASGGKDTKRVKVLIFCAGGLSSSLLIGALEEAASKADLDMEVTARSSFGSAYWDFGEFPVDIVLVAPQIRFLRKGIQKLASQYEIPVVVIEPMSYGMADGESLLHQVMKALHEKQGSEENKI